MVPPLAPEKASRKLKKIKAIGPDTVHAEYIKYGADQLLADISNILNKTSETGSYPEDNRLRILTPFTKPPKRNEKLNVRPIILL